MSSYKDIKEIQRDLINSNKILKDYRKRIIEDYICSKQGLDKQIDNNNYIINLIEQNPNQEICPKCNGTGTEKYCDAAGDMDDRTCSMCHGNRIIHVKKSMGEEIV